MPHRRALNVVVRIDMQLCEFISPGALFSGPFRGSGFVKDIFFFTKALKDTRRVNVAFGVSAGEGARSRFHWDSWRSA